MPQAEPPQQLLQQERIRKGRWQHRKSLVVVELEAHHCQLVFELTQAKARPTNFKDVVNS
jgi:hypothetical protein